MNRNETDAPLLRALDEFIKEEYAYFAIPGHRYDRGMPEALRERLGSDVYRYDLTESIGLDDLHNPKGAILEAEKAAARLFGADECRFSVNGTTALLEAMILACAAPGEEIVIARDAHRSAVSGLILSGAKPVWLLPEYDPLWNISDGIRPETAEKVLTEHPKAKAVMIVSPTYYGQASDIESIAAVCHHHGIPLLVDAAHGTHFPFSEEFPADSVSSGADLTAMSIHKTGGSMTQTSMLFYRNTQEKPLVDMNAVDAALRMTISSSPSYVLMASLDAARLRLEKEGRENAALAAEKAMGLRLALLEIPVVSVRGGDERLREKKQDPTRVVFRVGGISGTDLQSRLAFDGKTAVEMADARSVVAVVTAANTQKELEQFLESVRQAAASVTDETPEYRTQGTERQSRPDQPLFTAMLPEAPLLPRDAFFAGKEETDPEHAEGRICADIVCPYPPGVPILVPGERISKKVLWQIDACLAENIPVQGLHGDGMLKVVRLLEEPQNTKGKGV